LRKKVEQLYPELLPQMFIEKEITVKKEGLDDF
jgi:hypothetical protein